MGKLLRCGSGPDHLTVPLIIPPLAIDTTWYPLLWPVALCAPVNSIPKEIATTAARNILTRFAAIVMAGSSGGQVTKVIGCGPFLKPGPGSEVSQLAEKILDSYQGVGVLKGRGFRPCPKWLNR